MGGTLSIGNIEVPDCHRVSQVAFCAEVGSFPVSAVCVGLEEVEIFLWAHSVSADSLLGDVSNKVSRRFDIQE